MKKVIYIVLLFALCFFATLLFGSKQSKQINTYYSVSLNGEQLGIIDSDRELISYIEEKQDAVKKKYSVDNVKIPNDLQIQKIMTYSSKTDEVKTVYDKITSKANFTIEGYKVTITNDNSETKVYISDYDILEAAIEDFIELYVGKDEYESYKNGTQKDLTDLGSYLNYVYVSDNISIKKENVSVNEKIYTTAEELAQFLLYGENGYSKKYITSLGDTVTSIAFKNQISEKEFIMANPQISSSTVLLYPGQETVISVPDPKIQVVVEQKVIQEAPLKYSTIESVDENRVIGNNVVVQEGEDGILKVTNDEKVINGVSVYLSPISSEVIKPSVDKIIIKGGKKVSGVGSLTDWAWPLKVARIITDTYGWRINPVNYRRELHAAVDLGAAYGTPIYAADNGIIEIRRDTGSCGNTIEINHHNGYYTEYCHLSKFADIVVGQAVEKGQLIGYVGMTGDTTGPHLHFGVWVGKPWVGYSINPLTKYN